MIPRIYDNLEQNIKPGKVLVIYGPRQVGKTTLVKNFLLQTKWKYKFDSGDNIEIQTLLGSGEFEKILSYVAGYELLVLDEAQRIPNIGMALKIIVDQAPALRVIATGSSSFELAGQIGEPLTGRKKTLTLHPLSQMELSKLFNEYELAQKLADWLLFGGYPAVVSATTRQEKIGLLEEIFHSYLLKDILELERIKSPKLLLDLLRLLALQVGQQVSLTGLGEKLGLDYKTVGRYLDLLEKSFVIINLRGFSRNLRKEITKKSKYFFYDTGVRNAIISNFNELALRDDVGKLWENFLVVERLKFQAYTSLYANNYFWRTWDGKEIDWLEEHGGNLFAYEFKFNKQQVKAPSDFLKAYPKAEFQVVTPKNYLDFIVKK